MWGRGVCSCATSVGVGIHLDGTSFEYIKKIGNSVLGYHFVQV